MTKIKTDITEAIVHDQARFSMLAPGLVRLEYSPSGTFEDRCSVRAIARPQTIPFDEITETEHGVRLSTGSMIVEFQSDEKSFHAENLRVLVDAHTDATFWDPGAVDYDNLGGVHVSMDCIKPGQLCACQSCCAARRLSGQ